MPCAAAVRARFREHHVTAGRLHDADAVARGTASLGRGEPAGALAGVAALLPGDRQRPLGPAQRLVETENNCLVQIRAAFGRAVLVPDAALLEYVGEQITE